MAKLIALALVFAAFASVHSTTTTTIPKPSQNSYCSQQLQRRQFTECTPFLRSDDDLSIDSSCCYEVQSVDDECKCEAAKEAFRQALDPRDFSGGQPTWGEISHVKEGAENLTYVCFLIPFECKLSRQEQCSPQLQGQGLNHCQRYFKQSWSENILAGQNQYTLQSCCEALEIVEQPCRCEAVKKTLQQSLPREFQLGEEEITELRERAVNLPYECRLEPGECQVGTIPTTTTTVTGENLMHMIE